MSPTSRSRRRPPADRPYRRSRRNQRCSGTGVAAEDHRAYDAGTVGAAAAGHGGLAAPAAPDGLPILAELPRLADVLDRLGAADAALLDAVAGLAELVSDDTVEDVTGVGVEHWLGAVAAQTRMDRRLLLRACALLRRLPTLHAAVRDHRISFAQLRGITIGLRAAKKALDAEIDRILGALLDALDTLDRPDPDILVRQLVDALDELDPDDLAERERNATNGGCFDLLPHPDGTGARVIGDLDAAAAALVDAATAPSAEAVQAAGSRGAARLDALLVRLAGAGEEHQDAPADAAEWTERVPPPRLLVRLPFEALLDEEVPADLLVTLTGGRLRLTSSAARRLVDQAGARVRAIVVDDEGDVLGVGRSTRRPPGFLSDALPALHDTCTGPGCDHAARGAPIDHATPWWPTDRSQPPGSTDLDNLGPLCATTNRAKESAGWKVLQRRAGIRTWIHPRSGLTTTTVPSTWRPPGDPRRRPPRSHQPGHVPGPDDPARPSTGGPSSPEDTLPF